jgi:hypothetical protein
VSSSADYSAQPRLCCSQSRQYERWHRYTLIRNDVETHFVTIDAALATRKGQMIDSDKIIARFLEACATGEKVSHRVSLRALGHVMRQREPLREVIKLGAVHPKARSKFLEQWTKVAVWQSIRDDLGDDDLWFAALCLLLPAYDGPAMQLYRGQRINEALGMSWTRSYLIAEKFAVWGTAYEPEIKRAKISGAKPRDGQVMSAVMQSEIVCAPCLLGHMEGGFIVDPRNVLAIAIKPSQLAEAV